MLLAWLFGVLLTFCMISLEMIFLVLPRQRIFSFIPLVLRMLTIEIALRIVFSVREEPRSIWLISAGVLLFFIVMEMAIVVFFHSIRGQDNGIRFLLLLVPLSFTRACILVFVFGAGFSASNAATIGIVGFFLLYPMQMLLQIYTYQEAIWKDFLGTRYLLFKNRYYRMQATTWSGTYREVEIIWRSGYRQWKDGYAFLFQIIILLVYIFFLPLIALSGYCGWLLLQIAVHIK